jgi:hypothetical protein
MFGVAPAAFAANAAAPWLDDGPGRPLSARDRRKLADGGVLTLAGQPVPPADETKHFKMIGSTGTGKSRVSGIWCGFQGLGLL